MAALHISPDPGMVKGFGDCCAENVPVSGEGKEQRRLTKAAGAGGGGWFQPTALEVACAHDISVGKLGQEVGYLERAGQSG